MSSYESPLVACIRSCNVPGYMYTPLPPHKNPEIHITCYNVTMRLLQYARHSYNVTIMYL